MKRRAIILIIGIGLILSSLPLNSWGGSSCRDIPGLLLVKFKSGIANNLGTKKAGTNLTGIASVDQLNQRYNAKGLNKVFAGETSLPPPGSNLLDLSGFYEIEDDIIRSADYVVKYRQTDSKKNTPSSVIKVDDNGVIKIIRK